MTTPLLEVRDLVVDFMADEGVVEAVRGVSFTVQPGQTVRVPPVDDTPQAYPRNHGA